MPRHYRIKERIRELNKLDRSSTPHVMLGVQQTLQDRLKVRIMNLLHFVVETAPLKMNRWDFSGDSTCIGKKLMLSTLPLVFFMKVKLLIPLKGTTTYFSRKMQNCKSLWKTQLQIFSLRLSVSSLFKLASKFFWNPKPLTTGISGRRLWIRYYKLWKGCFRRYSGTVLRYYIDQTFSCLPQIGEQDRTKRTGKFQPRAYERWTAKEHLTNVCLSGIWIQIISELPNKDTTFQIKHLSDSSPFFVCEPDADCSRYLQGKCVCSK